MNNEFKTCITCNISKQIFLFHKNPKMKDGRINECKQCHHLRLKISRKDPTKKAKFKQYQRNSAIKRRYGITTKQFEEMVKLQNNRCVICGNQPVPDGAYQNSKLHIDHCHKTNKIRGLLCHLCNRGIGLFRERIDIIEKALKYLKNHS